jgi:DNA-binding transcriptional LysR family regulator
VRLEQLEYLLMISRSTSLTEASERLFITQQSLGKAIRDLEEELGVALLLRNNRGSVLTKEGYETLEQAKEILEKVHALQNFFEKEDEILRGKLIILCSQVMFSDELPLALESFSRQYQEVEVTAMEKDSYYMPILQKHLLETEDAVVISILHMPHEKSIGLDRISDTLQFHPIYKSRWMACMNSRNHLAKQKQIPVETLLKEKILISSPDYP